MNRTTQGLLFVVAVLIGIVVVRNALHAQAPSHLAPGASPSHLITHTAETPTGQQLTVIDSGRRAMAVYMIEKATGRVTLKSVRQLHWDLQLEEFNGVSPTPREIQSLLPR